jgi:hypothetical protein
MNDVIAEVIIATVRLEWRGHSCLSLPIAISDARFSASLSFNCLERFIETAWILSLTVAHACSFKGSELQVR